ncbi:substrate-binding domain-containing protein [Actinoplanes sp. NPDC048796]|uniref:substrate-binding domain-containing protein n=1 Tax=Actinoplanes sp. NPDC048796 TaxID=3155640 RepID=UPI003404B68B
MDEPSSHRSPEGGGAGRFLLAAAIVLMLVAVAGATTWWMYSREPADPTAGPAPAASASQCPDADLVVAAAPEIAPVVQAAARTFNDDPSDKCGPIEVVAEEPAVTASASVKYDVWIPSSSAWIALAGVRGASYKVESEPLARTPVVIAGPTSLTDQIAPGGKTSWAKITAGAAKGQIPAVTMADPQTSTIGMLSVYAVNKAMARTTPDAGIAQLRALTLRSRLTDATSDPAQLMARLATEWNNSSVVSSIGVFPTTEQQLKAYQAGNHTLKLDGATPVDGLVEADYPFAIAHNNRDADLTQRLRAAITKPALTRAGFRTTASPNAMPLTGEPQQLLASAALWSGYKSLTTQVLLLIDASGSMNQKITAPGGRSTTRAALLRESGGIAAELFAEDTSVGMWFFGQPTPSSPAHVEAVPFGPITGAVKDATRREALGAAMAGYRAADNSGTPLYQTVLDGVAEMRPKVRQGAVTLVVVLTDGVDGESTFKMSQPQFMQKLAEQQDPNRPVPVLAVGYGPDVDMKALNDMSAATGGKAFAATNPADLSSAIAKAFLAAHAPR